jgi:hypothetical protein
LRIDIGNHFFSDPELQQSLTVDLDRITQFPAIKFAIRPVLRRVGT